jgi:hypothetical protein
MTLLNQNEWEHQRDKDLANLFYYSLRFGNTDLVKSTAQKWKERYGEIDSLFYFSEKYEDKITPQLVGYYIIKNFQAFDLMSVEMLSSLKLLGLVFHNVADLMILSMKKKNMEVLNFLYQERQQGLKDGTYQVKGRIQAFIPSVIRQSIHSLEIFKLILSWNTQQEDLPLDTALAYGLGHALARGKPEVVAYIKENSSYTKVLSELTFILETNKNEFAMMAKNGRFGEYETVKDMIVIEFEQHLSLNLKEGAHKKLRKI